MGEYGSQQGPRPMRQSYQSPPSGLAEARRGPPPQSANQGQGGFNQQDFDPRSYTSEFQLPGVGPPDHSESSELRQKRRSILGNIGSNKATPSGSNTPASKSSERVNERINPQHVDQQLHRTFSYQSSFNEQQMIKGGKGQEKQGEDVLEQMAKATDPTQKRQKSKIFSPFKRSDTSSQQQQQQQQQEPTAADHARFATPPPESTTPPVAPSQLKKGRNVLQRNASSGRLPEGAMVTEKKEKKKRTSLLGSIFGRSVSSSNISKEEKQREKEEKKLRKTQSKGKLSKLQKANLTQPPVPEARSAAYAPVPDPSASFQGPNDAVQGTITEEPQSDMYAPDDQKPPVSGPGYPPGLQQPPPQSGYPGPGYPPPGPAMYGNGNGFGPHPPRAQPAAFRHRYYQQPQRALSQDRALYPNPPMPYPQQRRFSEQMQPYPPRAYQTPPPQQFRHPSAGSVHGSDYGAHLSPQVSAMTPPQPGQLVRQGTGDEMIVSPVTSRTGSSGPSEAGYFGPQQRGSPGRRTSDPFERQRMWYQQQAQQQQMMQQRRMGPITEHHPTPPPQHQQGSRPYPQAPWNVQHFPDHQQQRPYELSLPGADSDNDDSIGDDQQQRRPAPEKDEPAWSPASAGAYREVLPRGYPTATTSSPPHMYQPTSSPYPPIPRSSPYPPPPSSTSPPPHFSAADASRFPLPPSGSTTTSHTPSPTALRIEPRWKEVSPEEGEAELERLRDRHAQQQLAAQESVHPAYRHSPNPSVSGGNNNGSPRVPPGFEGASAHKRVASGELRMDPAYAKEYGIGTGKHGQEEEDDDDDEDLYAEPTYRSEESGRQGAMALEAAHSEAGESTPSPPTVAVGMAVGKEGEGARSRDEDEEAVVMHGASYPGMEWTPRWDGGVE
ncbi:hypothetical protein GTA08_BOTSDO02294 [Neofusicoccum parvum]|nr:hypothetical protein GTA08_BOTSDO02294 [Neofusicoccum parvum]